MSGSTIYAGGAFSSIGGQPRFILAVLNNTNGYASAWDSSAFGFFGLQTIRALVVSGSTVYAGGGFPNIGGQSRNHLAALDASTGAVMG